MSLANDIDAITPQQRVDVTFRFVPTVSGTPCPAEDPRTVSLASAR